MVVKILVIEDVQYLRNDVMEMLRFEGFDVAGAENGRIGVEVAFEYLPNMIICDIMMPELDGYGVLEALRADPRTRTIPFIFLTAKTDRIDVRQGMGKGADDYLTKPFSMNELLETINARLHRKDDYNALTEDRLRELRDNITTALPHELRTPLNSIVGFSDMLIMEAHTLQPEQLIEWAQHINAAGMRLYRLVENYVTFIRLESLAREPERLDLLRQAVTEIPGTTIEFQAMHRAQQHERITDLQVDVTQVAPVLIAEQDLAKIVDELMDNAFKFSQPGTPVTLQTTVGKGRLVIRISDQGRGITTEQANNIGAFNQFERWLYEQQGTGLGLVIAKRLTELFGGRFQIESAPEQGTIVTVTLAQR